MEIKLKEITVSELAKNYENNDIENGVVGFDGRLNIRPKYQREYVYDDVHRNKVIETVRQDFPLNVMYWATNSDNTFEVFKEFSSSFVLFSFADNAIEKSIASINIVNS